MTYHVGCVVEPFCGMVSYRALGGDIEEVKTPEVQEQQLTAATVQGFHWYLLQDYNDMHVLIKCLLW